MATVEKEVTQETGGNGKGEELTITAPNFGLITFPIQGIDPFVQLRFAEKPKQAMRIKMEGGSQQAAKGKKRPPRDFDDDYQQALYRTEDDEYGIPANAFRKSMISACRIVGFKMTLAKLAIFIEADGYDKIDGTPLVKIIDGEPEKVEHVVRNETGVVDIRVRAMWREWKALLRVRYDADLFKVEDIANLLTRAGLQVGVGEGRPDSKKSAGMGWGTFESYGAVETVSLN